MADPLPIDLVLSRLSHLNLTGCLPRQPREFVGGGYSGEIYKGALTILNDASHYGNGYESRYKRVVVAIKSLRESIENNNEFLKAFCKELYIWSHLDHINIVILHGFMVEDNHPSLILGWASNGTVIEYVKANRGCDRVKLCQGISDGVAYLHFEKNVIHSDLKGSNILVNDIGVPMLTCFECARMIRYTQDFDFFQTTSRDALQFSTRWTAYEFFDALFQSESDVDSSSREEFPLHENSASFGKPAVANSSKDIRSNADIIRDHKQSDTSIGEEDDDFKIQHTKETDVWAFGMVIYEIMTEEVPYNKIRMDTQVINEILRKKTPKKPIEMTNPMKALWNVCKECWVHDPKQRLNIREIRMQLLRIDSNVQSRNIVGRTLAEVPSASRETGFLFDPVLARIPDLNMTGRVPSGPRKIIGKGGFGDILRGKLVRVRDVSIGSKEDEDKPLDIAIKSIRESLKDNITFEKAFCKELYIWSKLKHENIVRLHGFIVEHKYPSIILEWAPNGTVVEYVKKNNECDRVKLCQGIANGIAYLHIEKNVIHSDLKGPNILVNSYGIPMLTDFGFARMAKYSQTFLKTATCDASAGSGRWMAKEFFPLEIPPSLDDNSSDEEDGQPHGSVQAHAGSSVSGARGDESRPKKQHTKETDIWALGMVFYEIISGEVPYYQVEDASLVGFTIGKGARPSKPRVMSDSMNALWKICKGCWVHDPNTRLKIGDVTTKLSEINSTVQDQALVGTTSAKRTDTQTSLESMSDLTISGRVGDVPPMMPDLDQGTVGSETHNSIKEKVTFAVSRHLLVA